MSELRAVTMPKWGIEMVEGTVAEWTIKEGDRVVKGQIVALIETDKITNEMECPLDGDVARLVAQPGDLLPVGALLAVLSEGAAPAGDIDAFIANFASAVDGSPTAATTPAAKPAAKPAAPASKPAAPPPPAQVTIPAHIAISPGARQRAIAQGVDVTRIRGSGRKGRITLQDVDQAARPAAPAAARGAVSVALTTESVADAYASPMAQRLAVEHGVDLAGLKGTGPRGRISKEDVLAATAAAPAATAAAAVAPAGGVQIVKMSPMRKAIARQLSLSKATIPHFYLRNAVRVDALLALREKAKQATGEAPSVNDYFIRGVALALKAVPECNVQVHDDSIHFFSNADISVAVATDKGLITPIVRAADTKSVAQISREVKELATRARAGKLKAEEFTGGSFSVSNLGMFGIDQFDAIINPPQGAILAIGAAKRQPVENGYALAFATVVNVSMSCDHRAIDGAVGAKFMAALRELLEAPEKLI